MNQATSPTPTAIQMDSSPKAEPWFRSPDRVALLEAQWEKWRGTPFFQNSNVPGPRGGVSCQKLAGEMLKGAGFWDVEVPDVAMNHGTFARRSLIEAFMSGRKDFQRFDPLVVRVTVQPGDIITFSLGAIDHHIGVIVSIQGKLCIVHAMEKYGVVKSSIRDGTYSSRIWAVWRPLDMAAQQGGAPQ